MGFARVRGPGQPDLVCDLVAASIAEEYLRRDAAAQLNVRVCGGHGVLFVAGEAKSTADFDVSAVVRRAAASAGVRGAVEPFISLEPIAPAWAPDNGTREMLTVTGYATDQTPEFLPTAVFLARQIARELERLRTGDPEWFWLGSDYEVVVDDTLKPPLVCVRAEHEDNQDADFSRGQIENAVRRLAPAADIRVNPAGAETSSGLDMRMGSSGQSSSAEQFGSMVPANASGMGRHLSHPLNVGAWLARQVAIDLVRQMKGKAVMVQATWLPLESRPCYLRARNEKGEDMSRLLDRARLDLAVLPSEWQKPELATLSIRQNFEQVDDWPTLEL